MRMVFLYPGTEVFKVLSNKTGGEGGVYRQAAFISDSGVGNGDSPALSCYGSLIQK